MGLTAIVVTIFAWLLVKNENFGKQSIKPPLLGLDIPFEGYEFNSDSDFVIQRETGTSIHIPGGSLVDSSGNYIHGKVTLKVRELHSAAAFFKAGIPMSIDNSRKLYLQSAGMIELRAFKGDTVLDFGLGKTAEISLAGFKSPVGYQLYYLDKDENWKVKDTFYTDSNTNKHSALRAIRQQLKDSGKKDLIVELIANLEEVPYLAKFNNLQWLIDKKQVNESLYNALRIHWDEVKIKMHKNKYSLSFTRRIKQEEGPEIIKSYTVSAIPLQDGQEVDANEMTGYIHEQDSILVYLNDEYQRVEKQAELLNSFKISKMGVWNIDVIMNMNDVVYKAVSFEFEKKYKNDIDNLEMNLLFLDRNSVLKFKKKEWNRIPFINNERTEIKIVLPGGKLVSLSEMEVTNKLKEGKQDLYFSKVY